MNFKELIESNQNNVRSIIRLITKETNEDLEMIYSDIFPWHKKKNEEKKI